MTSATIAAARLLGRPARDLATHAREHGPLSTPSHTLIDLLARAGLTGHGGAGFPTWRKLAAVVATGRPPVVVANAAEGEPASGKDRELLARVPHLVLDGLQLVADAVGARDVYFYGAGVEAALAQRARWDRRRVTVVPTPDRFVAGEESAVVAAVEGREAWPRDKTVRIGQSGVRGRPTLVQNVETLAHVALIARYGAPWFRQLGLPDEPGTFLATLSGAVARPGVHEAPYGVPLGELLAAAGGPVEPLQAVLVGGYHGAWVPPDPALPISRAGLRGFGASPGAGVVVALPASVCGLAAAARITGYLAGQSARQCGPCVNGLPRLADTLARLADRSPDPRLPAEVARIADLVAGRGACHHPDGTVRLVRSTLSTFDNEVRWHLAGRCTAAGRLP